MKGNDNRWSGGRSRPARGASLYFAVLATLVSAALAANVPAGWQTYRSADYGFTLAYPPGFQFIPVRPNDSESMRSIMVCGNNSVACLQYSGTENHGSRLYASGLSVNVRHDLRIEEECNQIDTGSDPIKQTKINGVWFHYGETAGVAGGIVDSGPVYRAFHNQLCFEIAVRFVFDNTEHAPGEIREFDSRNLETQLDRILHTFRFTGYVPH